jgi:hypothetical protein
MKPDAWFITSDLVADTLDIAGVRHQSRPLACTAGRSFS